MGKILRSTDYASLQAAIDAAGVFDTVLVPSGTHECSGTRLKSNLTLRLEAGAVLMAPRDITGFLPAEMMHRESTLDHCFFGGFGIENLVIEGEGIFECCGDAFWSDYDGAPSPADTLLGRKVYRSMASRPTAMLFINCRNLRLNGFTIRNAAAYTIWAIGCESVRMENLTIRNHRLGPNTDGLDIDCSRDVWISGCDINAGDDCIALKSDLAILGRDQACERIHISHCTLSSPCCAVRIGYEGDGAIRDVLVSDNLIHDSNKGFDLISVLPAQKRFGICHGAKIENIIFKGAVMRNVRQALAAWSGSDLPEDADNYHGSIKNLFFSDLQIDAFDSSFLGGLAVSEIALSNIRMHVRRNRARYRGEVPVVMPNVWGRGFLPQPLTFYRVDNPLLSDVRISMEEYDEGVQA